MEGPEEIYRTRRGILQDEAKTGRVALGYSRRRLVELPGPSEKTSELYDRQV